MRYACSAAATSSFDGERSASSRAATTAAAAAAAPAAAEPAPRGNTRAPRGAGGGARYGGAPGPSLPSGKRGVSSFLNRRAGAATFASPTKPADPNSVEAIQYRKDMANAKAAGVPYSTWVKKSREDLSTLTWQELAERMKKPYDPDSPGGGGGGGGARRSRRTRRIKRPVEGSISTRSS